MQECITHNFFSCYDFYDNRGGRPAGCLLGVAGVSLDASGHIVHRAGRGLWPTMANLRKNEYVFIFARFSAFMILRVPFAPPPLKWPVAASHCGRLTATLPTPKAGGFVRLHHPLSFFVSWVLSGHHCRCPCRHRVHFGCLHA